MPRKFRLARDASTFFRFSFFFYDTISVIVSRATVLLCFYISVSDTISLRINFSVAESCFIENDRSLDRKNSFP